jgi:ketosteroid isomerase-like protein
VQRAVAQHIAALAACDANALVASYTADATLFFPDGVVVTGRAALQDLYYREWLGRQLD